MEIALVSLTFDDGLRCQFERAVPILDALELKSTFFVVANEDATHTDGFEHEHPPWPKVSWTRDIALIKATESRGHEIGAHGLTHRKAEIANDPLREAKGSKEWIEGRLGHAVPSFCYPFNEVINGFRNAVVVAGFKQARCGQTAPYYQVARDPGLDLFMVDCRHIGATNPSCQTVDGRNHMVGRDGSEAVDAWVRPGHWHVLMFHGIGDIYDGWFPISEAEFKRQMMALAKLRDEGRVDVVTFGDGSERVRQATRG